MLKQAVLGAAIEGPATRYELQVRAQRLFPASALSSGGVYHAVAECERHGHLRRLDPDADDDGAVYVITSAGESYRRAWATRRASSPPGVRDELRCQIAFSEIEDLPWLAEELRRHIALVEAQREKVAPATVALEEMRGLELPWATLRRPVVRTVELGVIDGVLDGLRMALREVTEHMEPQTTG